MEEIERPGMRPACTEYAVWNSSFIPVYDSIDKRCRGDVTVVDKTEKYTICLAIPTGKLFAVRRVEKCEETSYQQSLL